MYFWGGFFFKRIPPDVYHSKKSSYDTKKGRTREHYWSRIIFLLFLSGLFIPQLSEVMPAQVAMTNTVNHARLTPDKPQISTHIQIFSNARGPGSRSVWSLCRFLFLRACGQNHIITFHHPGSLDRSSWCISIQANEQESGTKSISPESEALSHLIRLTFYCSQLWVVYFILHLRI